ncbi:MAG: translation initiation factor IF-2 [Sphingobacteriales bacterium]|nr:translation initiation factor IF-2 [Sphingobacteriales bacterium]
MAETPNRLVKAATELNIGYETAGELLRKKGFDVELKPMAKITPQMYEVLLAEFKKDAQLKDKAHQITLSTTTRKPEPITTGTNTPVATPNIITNNQQTESDKPALTEQPQQHQQVELTPDTETTVPHTETKTEPEETKSKQIQNEEPITQTTTTTINTESGKLSEDISTEKTEKQTPTTQPIDSNTTETTSQQSNNLDAVVEKENKPQQQQEEIKQKEEVAPTNTEAKIEQEQELVTNKSTYKVVGKIDLDALDKNDTDKKNQQPKGKQNTEKKNVNPNVESKNQQKEKEKKKTPNDQTKEKPDQDKQKQLVLPLDTPTITPTPPTEPPQTITTPVEPTPPAEPELIRGATPQLKGLSVKGKIDLGTTTDKQQNNAAGERKRKRKRKRIVKPIEPDTVSGAVSVDGSGQNVETGARVKKELIKKANRQQPQQQNRPNNTGDSNTSNNNAGAGNANYGGGRNKKKGKSQGENGISDRDVTDKMRITITKIGTGRGGGRSQKAKQQKKQRREEEIKQREMAEQAETKILRVTEFITASELAKLMDVTVSEIITACFTLGHMISINQRLDAELIEIVAAEFDFEVEFITIAEEDDAFSEEEEEDPNELMARPPIVTIMGHVDHGKTSLLDYIRSANVVAGEMGGITQHIGAYEVTTKDGGQITFLDTPGHEAFTAMRARGAKVTDIAVIVIAADDSIMPTTREAISHAQAAGVPMIFAFNKMDKPEANAERIREQLANMDLLVEEWGGKYQTQEISAKKGTGVNELLDKILLEAEMLELKANPNRMAVGAIIEASLDRGRGYVSTVLVQSGTLKVGNVIMAGSYFGKVKAMFNERGAKVTKAGPSTPVTILGFNGAPTAGDRMRVMATESDAKEIATRREQILREQAQRTKKHITLDEIGRRLALGTFKELNLIVKGDVDGSVEALCDSLQKLSTEEVQVRIIHKGVGAIIESDVLLASASDAIIIGFHVRPVPTARKKAEQESIDIRLYSIIYETINEIKAAMEGLLEPKFEERFVCNIEVREVFKITKEGRIGTVAGCFVTEGKVARDTKIRLVRDSVVVYTGEIESLRRYKDEVKEVMPGQECGISIKNFNDVKVGDFIEGYEEIAIKRTLGK